MSVQTNTAADAAQSSAPVTPAAPDASPGKANKKKFKKKRKKSVGKRIVALLLVLALLGGSAFGVYWLFFRETPQVAMTDKTTYGALDRSIEGSGTTVPAETLAITAVSRATIEEVYVKAGDTVEEGQLLYKQDDSEVDEKIADYEEQIEEYEDEINEYETSITDLQNSIIEYQEKIVDYYADIAEVNETRQNLTIKAGFSGKITNVNAEVGKNVNSNTTLAQLTDESAMTLTQYFSYAYADQITVGMAARISVSGQMLTLDGTVSEISWVERVTDEGMKCFAVTVELANPGALREGESASCYLLTDTGLKFYPALDGTLAYKASETITAEASGELTAVKVANYDTVTAGQVLFVIDSSSYDTQLENLQKQITNTEKQITAAEKQIANYEKKIESTKEKIETTYENIEEAEESRADYAMCSEISGKVMYCTVEAGDTPNTMMSIITIYNMDTMTISVNFDELDVDYISEGTAVTITRTSAERNTYYEGTITYLSPEATSSGGVATFAATIEIDSKGELSSGVSVSYKISLGDSEEGVLAPVSALKSNDDQYYLYVKADTRPANAVDLVDPETEVPTGFYAVPVEVGSSNAQYVRILSGVAEDTEVFTRYRQSAPSNGSTTSQNQDDDEMSFEDMFGSGQMPNMGGNMPNMGGSSGGSNFGGNMGGNSGGGNSSGGNRGNRG